MKTEYQSLASSESSQGSRSTAPVSNYYILQDKKKSALAAIQNNINSTLAPTDVAIDAAFNEPLPKELSTLDSLTSTIKQLNKRKDARIGIINTEVEVEGAGKTLIRDARRSFSYLANKVKAESQPGFGLAPDQLSDKTETTIKSSSTLTEEQVSERIIAKLKIDAPEKYAIQVLNQVRGAILLLDQDQSIPPKSKDEAKAKLYLLAEQSLTDIDKLPQQIEAYNNQMVSALNAAGIAESAEKLNFAKEIASFYDKHVNIATLSNYQENTNIELDVKLDPLSEEQKRQYQLVANWNGNSLGVPWFDNLEDYQKRLIQSQAAKIATGEMVIPAQLRELSGLRNAYQKTTAIQLKGSNELKIVASSLHSGAPSSKAAPNKAKKTLAEKLSLGFYKSSSTIAAEASTKDIRQNIANENIQHLASYTMDGNLNANILTSETTGFDRGENWISKQIRSAAQGLVSATSSPINHFRLWFGGGQNHTQFKNNLAIIADQLKSNQIEGTDNIQKFLNGDKTALEKAQAELVNLPDHLKLGLTKALTVKQLISQANSFGDNTNKNLEASAAIGSLDQEVKAGSLSSLMQGSNYKESAHFCKSGKDRTGLVMLKTSEAGISSELNIEDPQKRQDISFVLTAAGHTQTMAGRQGGTLGNDSIKTSGKFDAVASGEFTLPSNEGHLEGIINQKSSGYNSEIKTNPKADHAEAYKEAAEFLNKRTLTTSAIMGKKSMLTRSTAVQTL